jgi:hypothetical protein
LLSVLIAQLCASTNCFALNGRFIRVKTQMRITIGRHRLPFGFMPEAFIANADAIKLDAVPVAALTFCCRLRLTCGIVYPAFIANTIPII